MRTESRNLINYVKTSVAFRDQLKYLAEHFTNYLTFKINMCKIEWIVAKTLLLLVLFSVLTSAMEVDTDDLKRVLVTKRRGWGKRSDDDVPIATRSLKFEKQKRRGWGKRWGLSGPEMDADEEVVYKDEAQKRRGWGKRSVSKSSQNRFSKQPTLDRNYLVFDDEQNAPEVPETRDVSSWNAQEKSDYQVLASLYDLRSFICEDKMSKHEEIFDNE